MLGAEALYRRASRSSHRSEQWTSTGEGATKQSLANISTSSQRAHLTPPGIHKPRPPPHPSPVEVRPGKARKEGDDFGVPRHARHDQGRFAGVIAPIQVSPGFLQLREGAEMTAPGGQQGGRVALMGAVVGISLRKVRGIITSTSGKYRAVSNSRARQRIFCPVPTPTGCHMTTVL